MPTIDVLHNPWCFIESPDEDFKKELARKWDVTTREFNLWEVEDEDLPGLPKHVADSIRKARDPHTDEPSWHAGGSLFFLDGKLLDLSPPLKWPQIEQLLEERKGLQP